MAESKGKQLEKKLGYTKRNYFEVASEQEKKAMFEYAEGYKQFLDNGKTERESAREAVKIAKEHGFTEHKLGEKFKKGDKKYYVNRDRSVMLVSVGTLPLEQDGLYILASHIDAPRIDLKQVPLYEDSGMAFFKSHYYGGIKKYQWTAIPLALHGVVTLSSGKTIDIVIGEKDSDPVFYINDLLPHLGKEQMAKTMSQAISGEQLNIVVGALPYPDDEVKERIKLTVLQHINEVYGMTESDFVSAELSVVPAMKAKDVGFDRALIAAYGHDDRVCSYPALTAICRANSQHTVVAMLVDKEEIGSESVSGMQSRIFEDIMSEISDSLGCDFRKVRSVSKCLSGDVTAAYDPNFGEAYEKLNSAMLSCGTAMCKFTGSGGKSGSNDATAEFVGFVRNKFNQEGVVWQTAELGKVDYGGGGTVAKFTARLNIDTVDIGVPVISMHSPYEVVSKADLFSMYKAYLAFIK